MPLKPLMFCFKHFGRYTKEKIERQKDPVASENTVKRFKENYKKVRKDKQLCVNNNYFVLETDKKT